jgi:copper chaperone CopZ
MRTATILLGLILVLCCAAGCASGQAAAGAADTANRPVVTYRLRVEGMTCPSKCVREVKDMLATVPGIVNVAVDPPTQTAVVDVVEGTSPQALIDAIHLPYRASLM